MFRVRAGITLNVVLMIVTTKGIFVFDRSTLAIGGEDARKKVYMGVSTSCEKTMPSWLARGPLVR